MRVLFEGGSYSFLGAKTAGLIQGRASFKGGSLSRIYGMCSDDKFILSSFTVIIMRFL